MFRTSGNLTKKIEFCRFCRFVDLVDFVVLSNWLTYTINRFLIQK